MAFSGKIMLCKVGLTERTSIGAKVKVGYCQIIQHLDINGKQHNEKLGTWGDESGKDSARGGNRLVGNK